LDEILVSRGVEKVLKVKRDDGRYYGIINEDGYFYVNLYDSKDKEVDGYIVSFFDEDSAYKAALISERAFVQGRQSALHESQ
jgi:hypothetical protein